MSTIENRKPIETLNPQQLDEPRAWLIQQHADPIDEKLKVDLATGRMDTRINRALADHKAGNTQPR